MCFSSSRENGDLGNLLILFSKYLRHDCKHSTSLSPSDSLFFNYGKWTDTLSEEIGTVQFEDENNIK